MALFKRSDGYVLTLVVNGEKVGDFACRGVLRERLTVDGLDDSVYVVRIMSPLTPIQLGFSPYMAPPRSVVGSPGLNPAVIYANSSLVDADEARDIRSDSEKLVFGLSGAGAWVQVQGAVITLYVFCLSSDLYTACCSRLFFPSLAKFYTECVKCDEDDCEGCMDSGRHVDLTASFVGCIPDAGTCFCYGTCRGSEGPVRRSSHLAYLESEQPISILFIKRSDRRKGLPFKVSDCIGAKDAQGNVIPVRDDTFHLLKVDPAMSRLIVLACPVLKTMIMQHA